MNPSLRRSPLVFAVLLLPLLVLAPSARAEKVEVLLFGQPCQLEGPLGQFSEAQLRSIHQASPEQTPLTETPGTLKGSLDRLQGISGLPQHLKRYRDLRIQALENRRRFEEAVIRVHKTADSIAFAEATRPLIHARRHPELLKRLDKALKAGPSPRAWEELREYYTEFAGNDGEEEFHRTLRRLSIRYHCSFEEERSEEDASTPESAPQNPGAKQTGP